MKNGENFKKAIFFDRDGTLNVDYGYVHKWKEFRWIPGAPEAIKLCNQYGYLVGVVSNQAGVAKGHFKETEIKNLHSRINKDLSLIGAHIDRFEYCPHHLDAVIPEYKIDCPRRKPNPGMLISSLNFWKLKPENCFLVGDKDLDISAAKSSGMKGYLFDGKNLLEFIKPILFL